MSVYGVPCATMGDGERGAADRADGAPDADDREEALALLLGVRVRREAPELSDGHDVEDADPQEERDADAERRCTPSTQKTTRFDDEEAA